jgi:solute carrier family 35 protein E3
MHPTLEVAAIVVANMVSVIGVVATNKMVYRDGFRFPTTLMVFHFLCTWMFVTFAEKMRWFTAKKIPWHKYALLGAAQVGSVAFVNLSLMHNTVGTYQLFKFTNVLMTVLIEFAWMGKVYSTAIYASLGVLVVGVSVATVTQVAFSQLGLLFGMLGSVATAVYQIYNKRVQTECEVSALQLLQYEQPFTTLWAAIFACFSDDLGKLATVDLTQSLVAEIFVSCVFAFGVNLSCYLIIGKTSPLTYSVVGHVKTIGVLIIGFVAFHEQTTAKHMLGMLLAFGGIVWYSHISSSGGAKPVPPVVPTAGHIGGGAGGNSAASLHMSNVVSRDDASDSVALTMHHSVPSMEDDVQCSSALVNMTPKQRAD